jgi:hypothetical protein
MPDYDLGRAKGRIEIDESSAVRSLSRAQRAQAGLTSEFGRSSPIMQQFSRGLSAIGTIAKRSFQIAGIAAVGLATFVVASGIKMNASLETTELQFETLMGSADEARKHVASLFEFAKRTPFETEPIIEASRMLQTFGGDALNTEETLKRVGDAAAAVAAPINELGFWVGRAYSAIQGGQPFGEAAMRLQELAVLTPEARAEMEKLQASGASAAEVWAVFEKNLDKFNGAMEKQAGTWSGIMSTISDIFQIESARIMEPMFKAFKRIGQAVIEFSESPAWNRIVKQARSSLGVVAGAITRIVRAFETAGEEQDQFSRRRLEAPGPDLTPFQAAWAQMREELEKIDLSGAVSRAFVSIDFAGLISGFVENFGAALGQIDWQKFSKSFSEGITAMAIGVDWAAIISAMVQVFFKIVPALIDGIISGIIAAARENPIDFVLLILALGFVPVKIITAFAAVLSKIPIIGPFLGWFLKGFAAIGRVIVGPIIRLFKRIGLRIIGGLRGGIETAWLRILYFFGGIGGWITRVFANAGRWLIRAGRNIITGLWNGVKAIFSALNRWMGGIPGKILSALAALPRLLFDMGKRAITSLWDGMKNVIGNVGGWLRDQVTNMASKLDPRNWFSTPEEHYRQLFGDAFSAIGKEARRYVGSINRNVRGIRDAVSLMPSGAIMPAAGLRMAPLRATVARDGGRGLGRVVGTLDITDRSHAVIRGFVVEELEDDEAFRAGIKRMGR